MNLMVLPLWAWIVFYVLVFFMLVADLKMFGKKGQHEVLFWGIFGALVLRSIFIFAGAAMVERFEWVLGLFGLFLLYTGGAKCLPTMTTISQTQNVAGHE